MNYRLKDYEHIIREVLDSGGEFQIYPRGTSMLPLLREGRDWVTLVKTAEPPGSRDVILYKRKDGSYVLHRILKIEETGYVLCGDNQVQMERGVGLEQVIGVVNVFGLKGRRYTPDSARMKLYSLFWCFLPLRKLYFRAFGHRYPGDHSKKGKKEV